MIPPGLRDRPLRDPFVVEALEEWASREAAGIMVGLFVIAAAVSVVAIPPGLALGGRVRHGAAVPASSPAPAAATADRGAGRPANPDDTVEGLDGEPTAVL